MESFILPDDVKTTPVLDQYVRWKNEYPDFLLFFRMGDFYELFFDDAKIASEALDIALTARDKDKKIPMAGVPYHAAESYLVRLIKKGYKVAICEQMTEPDGRTLVERKVVRLVTPGTYVPEECGQDGILAAIRSIGGDHWAVGSLNPATGDLRVGVMAAGDCRGFLISLADAEILIPRGGVEKKMLSSVGLGGEASLPAESFDPREGTRWLSRRWSIGTLRGFGIDDDSWEAGVAFALLRYLEETQFAVSGHVSSLSPIVGSGYLHLDVTTQKNLELVCGDGPSLYGTLNRCKTVMGRRTLRDWILRPLTDLKAIERRLDREEIMISFPALLENLRNGLALCGDMERSVARLNMKTGNPRDLTVIRDTLLALPSIREALASMGLDDVLPYFSGAGDLGERLSSSLEDVPSKVLGNGRVIKDGAYPELDRLRSFSKDGQAWLEEFIDRERTKLDAPKLKAGYSRVFGYYIEIGKGALKGGLSLPDDYQRRQTLLSSERFVTPELLEFEEKMNSSEEEIRALEAGIYADLVEETLSRTADLQALGRSLGDLDVISSLAHVARSRRYTRPALRAESSYVRIKGGRHPVVEAVQGDTPFVPNDVNLDDSNRIALVTGPNMAGKSTYLRMTALLVIMAQMGSFIPAEEADIGLWERVFTRLGARDELARGNSTFMVEMVETASILHNVTDRSLVILDEVGRGTSTYDGMSIAWAVVEFLHGFCGSCPKVLFATHYHELVVLEERLEAVFNLSMAVKEDSGEVEFLHQVVKGPSDRSYGLEVARLAGLPRSVISRARELLDELERKEDSFAHLSAPSVQMEFLDLKADGVLQELASVSPDQMSPLQALEKLYELRKKARKAVPL